ncbi:MAG: hypothetical protein F6K24_54965, partial [Okeania sp. SIO2D1]|nr:hypothetical protein [Okeania sp. SIO2D1]
MDYEHLKKAIQLLANATQKLEDIVSEKSTNQASNQTVEFAQETIKKAMAEISAAINPPIINHIPDE